MERVILPIEEWVAANPKVDELIGDIVNHMDNASFDANGFDEPDFRRNVAISLRQFLEQ